MTRAAVRAIPCGFCGEEFLEDRSQPACRACPLTGLCRTVRCPHCGYENPLTPGWIERLGRLVGVA
jgi:hypothetical protein